MAVHIPFQQKAQEEAIELMMPRHNLLKPADGAQLLFLIKEMAVGIFYLTTWMKHLEKRKLQAFAYK